MSRTDDITLLIKSFQEITGIKICFYDISNLFKYHTDAFREYTGHRCELCTSARMLVGGKERCEASDRGEAIRLASATREPFFHKCHLGLYELLVPLYNGEVLVGLIFIGQCRIEGMNAERQIGECAGRLGGRVDTFTKMYNSLPLVKGETLLSIGNIIKLYFESLMDLENAYDIRAEGGHGASPSAPLYKRVSLYIQYSYKTPITPKSIAERFFVNQSYLSRHFRANTGETLTDYINRTRLEGSRILLKNSDLPISVVALNVGYTDANYFVKLFKKRFGMTPSEYRTK
jgi:AraC-like DNA-binding protein